MKATDIFIGIVDFFSTLLPGVFLIASIPPEVIAGFWDSQNAIANWEIPRWAVLLAIGYAVGQLLHFAGAKIAAAVYPQY